MTLSIRKEATKLLIPQKSLFGSVVSGTEGPDIKLLQLKDRGRKIEFTAIPDSITSLKPAWAT